MQNQKICSVCGRSYPDNTKGNNKKYCCPRCRYRMGNYKKRERSLEDRQRTPHYICQNCGYFMHLKVNPIYDYAGFKKARCPKCKNFLGHIPEADQLLVNFAEDLYFFQK